MRRKSFYLLRKFRGRPGLSHSQEISLPVVERVIYAVFRSAPPKQIFVVKTSGISTNEVVFPSAEWIVIPPVTRVATQTFPNASRASESNKC